MDCLNFYNDAKFGKDKLLQILTSYDNRVKGTPANEVMEMEIDFSINYNYYEFWRK